MSFQARPAHMARMRTITQRAELFDLSIDSIIVDDTDTPMQVIDPNLLGVLAGPEHGTFRVLADEASLVLPATVQWEPVS